MSVVLIVQTITDDDQVLLYLTENAFLCGGASGCANAQENTIGINLNHIDFTDPWAFIEAFAHKS